MEYVPLWERDAWREGEEIGIQKGINEGRQEKVPFLSFAVQKRIVKIEHI